MQNKPYFISETDFRVWLPDVIFKSSDSENEAYDSRKISGIMSTERRDRQGEIVTAKGLNFDEFLHNGHFNDNHSQDTSAIVGYPQRVQYHRDLGSLEPKLKGVDGWSCEGYVLKGTKRADGIWELAQALQAVPNKKLGFSIEGKVTRRANKTIESARIRNVAITNCPVNTDCTWNLIAKSMDESEFGEEIAMKSLDASKALSAGFGTSPGTQTGGGALRGESLESDVKDNNETKDKKKKRSDALLRALAFDDLTKAMDLVLESRPDFDEDTAARVVKHLFIQKGGRL